jgi:tetratricopeptide (TPR) repeat protein
VIKINPNKIVELFKQGEWRKLKKILNTLGDKYNNIPVIIDIKGVLAAELDKNYQEAERCFRLAISYDPVYPLYQWHLGLTLERQQKKTEALKVFQNVHKIDHNFEPAKKKLKNYGQSFNENTNSNKTSSELWLPGTSEEFEEYFRRILQKKRIDMKVEYWHGLPVAAKVTQVVFMSAWLIGLVWMICQF